MFPARATAMPAHADGKARLRRDNGSGDAGAEWVVGLLTLHTRKANLLPHGRASRTVVRAAWRQGENDHQGARNSGCLAAKPRRRNGRSRSANRVRAISAPARMYHGQGPI